MTKAKTAATTKADSQMMYIGPSVRKLGLINSRVYRGDCSAFFNPLKESYPLIGTLLVPIDSISTAKSRMNTQGSAEWLAVQQLLGGE